MVLDFNLLDVNWNSMTVNCAKNTENSNLILQREYMDLFTQKGLSPCLSNGTTTRRRMVGANLQTSQLDQVLTSNPSIVLDVNTVAPLGISDHLGIVVNPRTISASLNPCKRIGLNSLVRI